MQNGEWGTGLVNPFGAWVMALLSGLHLIAARGLRLRTPPSSWSIESLVRIRAERSRRRFQKLLAGPLGEKLPAHLLEDWATGYFWIEMRSVTELVFCGLWTSWPCFRSYISSADNPVFRAMVRFYPAEWWGTAFTMVGLVVLVSYLCGLTRFRRAACIASIVLWGAVSSVMLVERASGMATVLCPIIVGAELLRLGYLSGTKTWGGK